MLSISFDWGPNDGRAIQSTSSRESSPDPRAGRRAALHGEYGHGVAKVIALADLALGPGAARFTVDGEAVDARAGHVVVVPAGAAHGFKGASEVPVRIVSLHPAAAMEQTWLDRPALPPD
jgi:Cupin domain